MERFTTTIDTCGYGQGELIFRVTYYEDDDTTFSNKKFKDFSKMLVQTDNDAHEKTIGYWPVGESGVTVYDDSLVVPWYVDEEEKYSYTKQRLGYKSTYNQTINIIKSTLLDEQKIADIYAWLTENATKHNL